MQENTYNNKNQFVVPTSGRRNHTAKYHMIPEEGLRNMQAVFLAAYDAQMRIVAVLAGVARYRTLKDNQSVDASIMLDVNQALAMGAPTVRYPREEFVKARAEGKRVAPYKFVEPPGFDAKMEEMLGGEEYTIGVVSFRPSMGSRLVNGRINGTIHEALVAQTTWRPGGVRDTISASRDNFLDRLAPGFFDLGAVALPTVTQMFLVSACWYSGYQTELFSQGEGMRSGAGLLANFQNKALEAVEAKYGAGSGEKIQQRLAPVREMHIAELSFFKARKPVTNRYGRVGRQTKIEPVQGEQQPEATPQVARRKLGVAKPRQVPNAPRANQRRVLPVQQTAGNYSPPMDQLAKLDQITVKSSGEQSPEDQEG